MNTYIVLSKDMHELYIVTGNSYHDLFWNIDEFCNPYSVVFSLGDKPLSIGVPLHKKYEDRDADEWYVSVPKTRDVQLGEWLEETIMDFCIEPEDGQWLMFTSEHNAIPYERSKAA